MSDAMWMKPLKFTISIGLLLGTVALVFSITTVASSTRRAIEWSLWATMIVELAAIVIQAARGTTSHWNTRTVFDATLWRLMLVAILVALGVLVAFAIVVTTHPLRCDPMLALAIRLGAWCVILTALSGFMMGGRGSHSVGAEDLRVPHFFALHGLQAIPLVALVLARVPLGAVARGVLFGLCALGWYGLAIGSFVRIIVAA